jgi:hypothetical protein
MQGTKIIGFCWILLISSALQAQENDPDIRLARQLDSLAKTTTVSRHFASLYLETTLIAIDFFNHAPAGEKQFIEKLEQQFAGYFFKAVTAAENDRSPVWKIYFRDSTLSPLQYQLLGINAHINGDIWQALTSAFSLAELKLYKKSYNRFQSGLKQQFRHFYQENRNAAPITRLIDRGSAGLAVQYGTLMLSRWRKRQYRLAILHFTQPEKCRKRLAGIMRKKERLDRLILHHL